MKPSWISLDHLIFTDEPPDRSIVLPRAVVIQPRLFIKLSTRIAKPEIHIGIGLRGDIPKAVMDEVIQDLSLTIDLGQPHEKAGVG